MRTFDLTHVLTPDIPVWPGDPAATIKKIADHETYGYYINNVSFSEHAGTHIGAPAHFTNGKTVDQIPAGDLVKSAIKIDITQQCKQNRDYLLTAQDIKNWESQYRKIPAGCIVLIETGWSGYWGNPNKYLGIEQNKLHFPGIGTDAAKYLLSLPITGAGIDTAGIDGGLSKNFEVNRLFARNNIYHLENLANLSALSQTDITLFIGALPIQKGSGSPCRVLATVAD